MSELVSEDNGEKKGEKLNRAVTPTHSGLAKRIFLCEGVVQEQSKLN